MQAILDHLTAILVGATLLGAMMFIQFRQQQSSIETVARDRVHEQTTSFFDTIEREVENARTRPQSVTGLGYYVMEIQGNDDRTDRFTFTTFEPTGTNGQLASVSYVLVPTGETVRVGTALRNTYDLERWSNRLPASGPAPNDYTREGIVATDLVTFRVRAFDKDGSRVTWAGTNGGYARPGATASALDPVRFEIEVEGATEGPRQLTGDQLATSEQTLARVAHSIRPINASATGSLVSGPTASARDLPLLPGEPAPPPPPPPTPSPTPSPNPSPQQPPTPAPSPSPNPGPAPGPPPRPAAPPGYEV
ncbi:MAG: hypothetical protein AAGI52_14855 [Bacteroidota bacterium]